MNKTRAFVEALRTEQLGFFYGKPWRYAKENITCVVPVLRENANELPVKYVTLAGAGDKVEIKDTGRIDTALVLNHHELPVYLRMGELLMGDTQNRTLVMSRVVMPGAKVEVDIKCVHAGKGIRTGATFTGGTYTPGRESYYVNTLHTDGLRGVSQNCSWKEDRETSKKMKTSFKTMSDSGARGFSGDDVLVTGFNLTNDDNITKVRDDYNKAIQEVIKAVPLVDNQTGIAIIGQKGFESLDCYDIGTSWKDVKEGMVEKEGLSISQTDTSGVFEYKPDKASQLIKDVLAKGFEEKVLLDEDGCKIITLDFKDYVGEAVELDGEVIHLLVVSSNGG